MGLIWSPFAFMNCSDIATKRGADWKKPGLAAVVYSILYLWPYILLNAKLNGLPIPAKTMIIGYVILYMCWALSILSSWFHGLVWMSDSGLYDFILPLLLLGSAAVSTVLWLMTIFQLNYGGTPSGYSVSLLSILVRPFLFAFCGLILNNIIYFLLYFR